MVLRNVILIETKRSQNYCSFLGKPSVTAALRGIGRMEAKAGDRLKEKTRKTSTGSRNLREKDFLKG